MVRATEHLLRIFSSLDSYFETLPCLQPGVSQPSQTRDVRQSAGLGCGVMWIASLIFLYLFFLQDREPLRTIFLKDVLKTHECLVKSG